MVDPSLPATLRALRTAHGWSYRRLARAAHTNQTSVWQIETSRRSCTPEMAAALDAALGTGELSAMVYPWGGLDPDADARLAAALADPTRVDPPALSALAALLADLRHLEDEVGSRAVLAPVMARVTVMDSLAADARGPLRQAVLDQAAQWAQLAGWLHANLTDHVGARRWYGVALGLATETGDARMASTALSMRGHVAWLAGNPDATVSLAGAALRQRATPGTRALAAQMRARAHAELGEVAPAERYLGLAATLLERSAGRPEDEPAWQYFYGPTHLRLQGGLAYNRLGRYRRAADALTDGLASLPAELRAAEWMQHYVCELAFAHTGLREREAASAALDEAEATATATGSARLGARVATLRAALR